jgi:hypothetical protein
LLKRLSIRLGLSETLIFVIFQTEEGEMNIKLSAANIVSIIILMCILAAMVSIAIMQVVRTVEDIGPKIYIVGGAVIVVGAIIPLMLIILVKHLKKYSQD